jgi:hypothetical protein
VSSIGRGDVLNKKGHIEDVKLNYIHFVFGFEVSTAVTMKVFWDVEPCGLIINRRFGGTCPLHLQGRRNNASKAKC